MRHTPNFANWRAVVLHRADSSIDRLSRQLRLFGFRVKTQWEPLSHSDLPDIVLVDADQGWDGLLPWDGGEAAPCPIVALLGSEAPSRIAWALEQGAGAILAKPINTSAVFPALVMAQSHHEKRAAMRERLSQLEERLRLRPIVHSAAKLLAERRDLSEEEAHALLRGLAMRQRQPIEVVSAAVLAGTLSIPEAG